MKNLAKSMQKLNKHILKHHVIGTKNVNGKYITKVCKYHDYRRDKTSCFFCIKMAMGQYIILLGQVVSREVG